MNLYIRALRHNSSTGIVSSIVWAASKISDDGTYRAETKGEQFLRATDATDPSFVEYGDIDLALAERWLRDALTVDGLNNIEQYLDAVLVQHRTESEALGNPWQVGMRADPTSAQTSAPTRRTHFPVVQS